MSTSRLPFPPVIHPRLAVRLFAFALLVATILCPRYAHAQAGLPDSFKPTIDGTVMCVARQTDGKVLIGGTFANVGGVARACIARLDTDGTLDTTFDPGTGATSGYNNEVTALAVQSDGKILVGGDFSNYNGNTNYHNLIRVNADGSLDTTYAQNSSQNIYYGIVYGIAVQPADGKAIVGGSNNINGGTRLVRLNTDGSLDSTFDVGTGPSSNIYCLTLQPDGKIVIGGDFTAFAGTTANHFARVNTDGSLDTSFSTSVGANNPVYSLAVQNDGSIVLGGQFSTVNGTTANEIVRVYSDATIDPTFISSGFPYGNVLALAIQADGKILAGGGFNSYNGVTSNDIVRINADGTQDATFQPGVGANGNVNAIVLQPDGKSLVGGAFTTFEGLTRTYLARLNSDTSSGGLFNFAAATSAADQASGSLTVTVTRTLGQTGAASVNATTANGTATSGTDYTYTRVTLNWADGDTAPKSFNVPLLLSDPADTTKTFTIGLSGATGGILGATATTTVTLTLEGSGYVPPTPTPPPSTPTPPPSTPTPPPSTPTPPPSTPTPPPSTPTPPPSTPTPSPSSPTPTPPGTVSPTPTPALPTQSTVAITSPPDGITVVAGADLPLAASVTDPDTILASVQFFIDGTTVGTGTAAPFVFDATAPTSVGSHTVQVVATDTYGRTNTSGVTLNVAAATGTAAPTASVVSPIDGRSFAAGSTLPISITAAADASTSLDHVSLYANGTLIGTFAPGDSSAQAIPARQPTRRDAAVPASNVFQTSYTLPAANAIVNMIAVALDKLGQSSVSHIATITSVVTGDQPPTVALSGLSNGAHVPVGSNSAITVTVTVAGGSASSAAGHPTRQDASAGTLSLLEYYLNGSKIAESQALMPPFSFTFTPPASGKYVLDAVATDSTGLSSITTPITVQADVPPTVSLALGGTGVAVEGGANGVILVTRTGDTSQPLTVLYKAKGAAVAGVDYKKLPGSITIPAGAVKAKVKVKPIDGSPNASTLKLKIQLLPSTDGSYGIGTGTVKLKLIGN